MGGNHIKNIFLILMENNNWSTIQGNSSAPYINNTLLPAASWCTNYFNPPGNHPSEPNYVWLEAGTATLPGTTNFGSDGDPSATNSTTSTQHLATLLTNSGKTWREYAEGISGSDCPINSSGLYAAKHNPFVFFQDISGNPPSSTTQGCAANMKQFSQLASDLSAGTVADYNFITPNLCNDMHGAGGCPADLIATGDTWLSQNVPVIMASNAYKNGGAIFITWDEGEGGDGPIGMIVLSPFAKGGGYQATTQYDHSSMVRTVEDVFGLMPLLANATTATPLSDLFKAGMYP
jgi:phospholipase C